MVEETCQLGGNVSEMNARMQKEMCEIALIMDSAGGCDCLCLFSFFHSLFSRLLLELRLGIRFGFLLGASQSKQLVDFYCLEEKKWLIISNLPGLVVVSRTGG